MNLVWQKISDYCIRAGDYRIAKVVVNGDARYECWHGKDSLGTRYNADTARELCEQHANQEQAA